MQLVVLLIVGFVAGGLYRQRSYCGGSYAYC